MMSHICFEMAQQLNEIHIQNQYRDKHIGLFSLPMPALHIQTSILLHMKM